MGDIHKLVLLESVVNVIQRDSLLANVRKSGAKLLLGLKELQDSHSNHYKNARGLGTFCSIDCATPALRDKIVAKMRTKGIHIGGCGENSIRFRPALIFQPHHVDILLSKFVEVSKEL